MGLRDFIRKLAYKVKQGLINPNDKDEVAKLQEVSGLRKKNQGGMGRFASPRRIANRKSVARFWNRFTPKGLQVLGMRMKLVQQKQPSYRKAMRASAMRQAVIKVNPDNVDPRFAGGAT
mgnify:CR=1 FL=1